MVAGGLAGGDQSTAGVLPDAMLARLTAQGELVNAHQRGDLISCHGSLKDGDGGNRFLVEVLGVDACDHVGAVCCAL